jgi:hypothetical protein
MQTQVIETDIAALEGYKRRILRAILQAEEFRESFHRIKRRVFKSRTAGPLAKVLIPVRATMDGTTLTWTTEFESAVLNHCYRSQYKKTSSS